MASTGSTDTAALRASCTRFFFGHGPRPPADKVAEIPTDTTADVYGQGGVVAELESEVAAILGKPAALFFPSGTMAQQAALRAHVDRRASRTIVFHPYSHLDRHELRAYERLHGMTGRTAGDMNALITLDDLRAIAEPIAALVLELPQRDLGGQLPRWKDLVAQTSWARDRGAAVHLDGARLWQCASFYRRTYAEISALFDTVYVSFYKDLGGIAGAALAGPQDVVDEAREWRKRHGGTLVALWPFAASALHGVHTYLPRMKAYTAHARAIARALKDVDGVEVVPDPPQTSMMHLLLRATGRDLRAAVLKVAREQKVWTFGDAMPSGSPSNLRVELSVGEAAMRLTPPEFARIVATLVARPKPKKKT